MRATALVAAAVATILGSQTLATGIAASAPAALRYHHEAPQPNDGIPLDEHGSDKRRRTTSADPEAHVPAPTSATGHP